jgi:hypothetical protein
VTQEERIDAFKRVLGDAVMLGMRIGRKPYRGLMSDPENAHIPAAVAELHGSIDHFLQGMEIEGLSAAASLPLYQEIQTLLNSRK